MSRCLGVWLGGYSVGAYVSTGWVLGRFLGG